MIVATRDRREKGLDAFFAVRRRFLMRSQRASVAGPYRCPVSSPPHDPIAALNQILSEVIDVVLDVKQAYRHVPATHALHAELDELSADLRSWAELLARRDDALGVSPLANMASVAGRELVNLWPGAASDQEVGQVVDDVLDRLGKHVAAAMAVQDDDESRAVLADVERGVLAHRRALSA
jgi:DNA-binding ferritin-like protein